ncbi:MAG: oligopeptidase [Acidobacteriota bacterium]|nr:oligopeptidase [Acidobacteriota bacterium]
MKRSLPLPLVILFVCFAYVNTMAQDNANPLPTPPTAKRIAKTLTYQGESLTDNYFWLREKKNPEVISYLESENAYTDAMMKSTEAFQKRLYDEMLARVKQTDQGVPYKDGAYRYYTRTVEGKQYPIFARKHGSDSAPEEITLDLNEMAKGHSFMSVAEYEPSDDQNLLAYSTDTTGFREYTLYVKDLRTGADTKIAERVSSAAWAADNRTIFYVVDDPVSKRSYRLYRHTLGGGADDLIYEEKDELFDTSVGRTRSRAYVLLTISSHTTSEVRYLAADKPASEFRIIEPRQHEHEYYVDHRGDTFYIRSNMNGSRNFFLLAAPVADPARKNWKEIVPYNKDVMLNDVDLFKDFMVLSEREAGLPRLRVTDLRSNKTYFVEFPEPVYTAGLGANREFDTKLLRYNYQSFITPSSTYDYDMTTRKSTLLKQQPVLGGYDQTKYASERVYATAADGTRVPISLYYRKDLRRDGSRPMLLNGYGSYGISSNVTFSSARLSLVDRGVIYAVAHIRGGGEMGKGWHDQGRMMNKKNTFTDFIAAAEHLVNEKYTSKDRLVITGGSAGGLLMGAVTNMRPDLFKAVVAYVPFVDVMNTMMDATLPLTAGEWEEWGNPVNNKENYAYMKSYSPYDNIEAKAYPTILVRTSLNDSQVMYWEPAKYVAKLRAMKTDKNPLMLKINMGAGHGGASGRYDALHDTAFDYAFILSQFGITN